MHSYYAIKIALVFTEIIALLLLASMVFTNAIDALRLASACIDGKQPARRIQSRGCCFF